MTDEPLHNDSSQDIDLEPTEEVIGEENAAEKLKKLREKLKETEAEKQKYLTSWQRAQAEFMNIRKRDEESKKEFLKFANENILNDLLGVADSFSMAFANKESWEKVDKNWRAGVEYIYSQFLTVLKDHGLREFDPTHETFDPSQHLAVETITTHDQTKDHKILEVIQKGYILQGKVVRPAKVKVGSYIPDTQSTAPSKSE